MSEICTAPIVSQDEHGDEYVTFGPEHTLRDICRWIMRNRSEAEEVYRELGEMLGTKV